MRRLHRVFSHPGAPLPCLTYPLPFAAPPLSTRQVIDTILTSTTRLVANKKAW